MSIETERKRDYSLDVLRILACVMVVGIHTSMEGWYNISPRTYTWTVLNFYDTLFRPAVPLFVMISGSLFLRKKQLNIKRLWCKNILHLSVIYCFWVVFYAVMSNGIHKTISDPAFIWKEIIGPNPQYHLWYLRTILNLYVIAPILWYLVRALDRKQFRYYFMIFFVFGILRRTLFELPFLPQWLHDQINLFVEMDLVGYAGYFILGYYLCELDDQSRLPAKSLLMIYIGTVIAAAGLNQWIAAADNWPTQALYGNFSLPVAVESVCIFVLIRRSFVTQSISERSRAFIEKLSASTLFVYLIHPFMIQRMQMYFHLYTTNYNVLFSVPLVILLVFGLSAFIGMILHKIPVINRIVS